MKKFLSMFLGTAMAITPCAISSIGASAASTEKIYADIVYEDDGTIEANIIFENMPELASGGFFVTIGDGWEFDIDDFGEHYEPYVRQHASFTSSQVNDKKLFFTFTTSHNYNMNGTVISVHLKKAANNTPNNSTVNVDVVLLSDIENSNPIYEMTNPIMLSAHEYMIGDTNGDNKVDARDSSFLLYVLDVNNNQPLYVNNIKNNHTTYFPNAKCAAAADVDKDGIISTVDSSLIRAYYADIMSEIPYNGIIGKIDFFEIFND
ncbi:MAG: hypothetical protein J6L05_00590 [Ruminococcus sp.]|nr:hypothetical protein [Ruminococcus sp.]